ncbi:hypothetical protein KJ599_01115 [bacterium]|nr:hypothetical protein [bacterium]
MTKADEMKSLAKDIIASHKDREKWNSSFSADCKRERKERVKDIKENIIKSIELIKGLTGESKERAAEVVGLLAGFKQDDQARAEENKDSINKTRELMAAISAENKNKILETIELIKGFTGESKERAAEVVELVSGFKKEREEAASAWKELLTKMSAKEKKISLKPEAMEPKEEEVSVPEPIEPKVKEVSIPEALQPKKRELSLEEKMLEFIKKHPEGVKVGEMEGPLGVIRMQLGRIAKKLLDEGKVRKEENLYFPL